MHARKSRTGAQGSVVHLPGRLTVGEFDCATSLGSSFPLPSDFALGPLDLPPPCRP